MTLAQEGRGQREEGGGWGAVGGVGAGVPQTEHAPPDSVSDKTVDKRTKNAKQTGRQTMWGVITRGRGDVQPKVSRLLKFPFEILNESN